MKRMINNLRNQPEHVRRHVLHVATIIVGIILILLWIYSLGVNFTDSDTQAQIQSDLKPFSTLKANLIDGYQSISQ